MKLRDEKRRIPVRNRIASVGYDVPTIVMRSA